MNQLTLYFISGSAFIGANITIILAVIGTFFEHKFEERKIQYLKIIDRILLVTGVLLLYISSPAIPGVFIQVVTIFILGLIFAVKMEVKQLKIFFIILRAIPIVICLFILNREAEYRKPLVVPAGIAQFEQLHVIGDSITAGIGTPGEVTWPEILFKEKGIWVNARVAGGATLEYAIEQAESIPEECVLILEIGGNDILAKKSPKNFEKQLEKLLKKLSKPGQIVIMVELPLPPMHSSYGLAQRNLARKYNIHLIPKPYFSQILTKEGTVDGLHLSNSGHRQMANLIWSAVKNLFPEKKVNSR